MLTRTQQYDENGDILAPEFFVESQAKLAGVFNSGLDRDNFGQNDIASGEFTASDRPFNVITYGASESTFTPDIGITSWQGETESPLHREEFTAEQDGLYLLYWSGAWSWSGNYSMTNNGAVGARENYRTYVDTIRFRISVDGAPVAVSLPFEDANVYHSTYLCAAIVLAQGTHVATVGCEVVRRVTQTGNVRGVVTNTPSVLERTFLIRARER